MSDPTNPNDPNEPTGTTPPPPPASPYGGPAMPPPPGGPGSPYGAPSPAGYQPAAATGAPYAQWIKRVGAYLIDAVPLVILNIVVGIVAGASNSTGVALIGNLVVIVASIGWVIYNYGMQQGTTGYSLGKGVLGIKLISEETGQPIGIGLSIARVFVHILDALPCYIGYLWPLWDEKRQTFADKILHTVVVEAPKP